MKSTGKWLVLTLLAVSAVLLPTSAAQDRKLLLGAGGASAAAFSPSDLGNQVGWFKADALSASNGDPITTWADSFASAHDITQPTSGKRPSYFTSRVNGKPALQFDGSGTLLRSASAFTWSGSAASIFVVAKESTTTNGDVTVIDDGGTTFYELRVDNSTQIACEAKNTSSGGCVSTKALTGGAYKLYALLSDSSTITAYVNGTAGSSISCSGTRRTGSTKIQVGEFGLGFQFYGGDIAEIVIYDALLSSTDRGSVETYLNNKYALY